jgi:hypothetical protein
LLDADWLESLDGGDMDEELNFDLQASNFFKI